jgi:hypothetical protein
MKGIYLTEQGKAEIQAKIAELKDIIEKYKECKNWMWFDTVGQLEVYKEILSSATILPVEEDWSIVGNKSIKSLIDDQVEEGKGIFEVHYPNGVIIQPKQ